MVDRSTGRLIINFSPVRRASFHIEAQEIQYRELKIAKEEYACHV